MFCVIFVNKCASLAAVWCSFDSNLCSLIFYSCSLSSYLCYPLYLFPSTNIFCLYPPYPISRYFCKESLMTPPPQHTSPLQVSLLLLLPLQKFSSYYFLHFPLCSFVFHSCSLVFIHVPFVFSCVHSCSLVFTRVHSCSTRVPLVFIRVHSCSFVFHSCSFVFTRVHSCSLVFTRVHSCSLVFRSVWCFRYDRIRSGSSPESFLAFGDLEYSKFLNSFLTLF